MNGYGESYREYSIESVADLVLATRQAFGQDGRRSLWFRGHASAGWELVPSVHRHYTLADEVDLTTRFRLGAPTRHVGCPGSKDFAGWLCLMQHFGLPTRLLDWTESALIAAFFAVGFEEMDDDAAVWVLNAGRLNRYFKDKESLSLLGHPSVEYLLHQAFLGGDGTDDVLAVQAPDVDLRMALQQSVFTIHGSERPLESHPRASEFLEKIVVPARARTELHRDLWLLGIRRSLIFPDLPNLAIELQKDMRHEGRGGSPNQSLQRTPGLRAQPWRR